MIRNLSDRLEQVLTSREKNLLRLVSAQAESLGLPLYMVGGLPRDLVLGRGHSDFDLVVEGSAIDLARALSARHGGEVTLHRRFGTTKWNVAGLDSSAASPAGQPAQEPRHAALDLISARTEVYLRPAQLPQIRPGTIEDDLRRRDFTINTLAIRLDGVHYGQLLDPLGAAKDLKHREIHVLHGRSFVDDPTRMFRAVRYEQRLGFRIGVETLKLIGGARQFIALLSAHRVRHELDQILDEARAATMVQRLSRLGLLEAVHVALPADAGSLRRLATHQAADSRSGAAIQPRTARGRMWMLWLMDLSPAQIRSVRKRLEFDRRLTGELLACSTLRRRINYLARLRPSTLTHHLSSVPVPSVETLLETSPPGRQKRLLGEFLATWRHMRPRASGRDLKELGIPPGGEYRTILAKLRAAWIDGRINSAEAERALLLKLARRHSQRGVRERRGK